MNKKTLIFYLSVLALTLTTPAVTLGQELGNWTFDTDLEGWMLEFDLGIIERSVTQGQPPGAARLSSEGDAAIPGECFHFAPGNLSFTADGFMETSGEPLNCSLNFFLYTTAEDCTGPFTTIPIVGGEDIIIPFVQTPNQWEHLTLEIPLPAPVDPTGVRSFRPTIIKGVDNNNDDACVFDNINLRLAPLTTIPTTSPVGLVVLGLFLAIAGFVLVRRVSM
jgi:hypothetical protein